VRPVRIADQEPRGWSRRVLSSLTLNCGFALDGHRFYRTLPEDQTHSIHVPIRVKVDRNRLALPSIADQLTATPEYQSARMARSG
jgi:hypothetical protein